MIPQRSRNVVRQRVHDRIRTKVQGTAERPRLNVYRSVNHIYAQIIDDADGKTLVSGSADGMLKLWDLPFIHRELSTLGLEW